MYIYIYKVISVKHTGFVSKKSLILGKEYYSYHFMIYQIFIAFVLQLENCSFPFQVIFLLFSTLLFPFYTSVIL